MISRHSCHERLLEGGGGGRPLVFGSGDDLFAVDFAERGMSRKIMDFRLHLAPFPAEKILHGIVKPGVAQPVGGESFRRQIAAGKLVRALRAGLHPFQPMCDGIVYGAVVTGFEMQETMILKAAPVAAIQAVAAFKVECPGDIAALPLDHEQDQLIGKRGAEQAEKLPICGCRCRYKN